MRSLADLAWLSSRPTRDALHPAPLAEALLHRHRATSAAAASQRRRTSFELPCRATRARFAPWRTGRPPTEHARAGGLGVVVFAANARRAPSHAVGRGSSSPTPRQVGGCGFETTWPTRASPVARGPRALRPVENQPTAHGARARWRTWRGCLRGQRAARSTPRRWPRLFFTDTAPGRRLRLRNVVTAAFESRGARPARASPRGEPADRPRSTRALADLAWLSSRPTRGALHPTPLAEALLHRHRARSAAAASKRRDRRVRLPWRAARARFAPWRTGRPLTEHARAGGLGVVVFAANARHAPPHAVGRGSSSPTPRQVGGCGFETPWPQRPTSVARGPRALRPVENRPTAHGARRALADLAWLSSRPTRDTLHPTPLAEALLHRHRARSAAAASKRRAYSFESRAAQPARASPRGEPADRPRSTRALADLAWLSSRPTRDALHPTPLAEALLHRHRARSAAVAFERRGHSVRVPCRAARARFAPWRTGRPPTEHARAGGLGVVVFAANARRAPPHAVGRGSSSPTPRQVGGCGFERRSHSVRVPWRAARARFAPWRTGRPPTEHARAGGLGVVVFAANARRAPPHAVGRGSSSPTPRQVGGCGFERVSHSVRVPCRAAARASPRGEPADRPRSTRALADLAWLSLRPTRGALHPTPLAEALLHRHRARSAAAASNARDTAFESRGARPARASPRGEPADRPRSTRALADLAWLSSRPTRGALHPTPLAEALLHRHRARSAAAASNDVTTAFESRGARPARASPRGEPADRPRSTRALADLAWLSSRPTRGALHPTPLAEAPLHRHRARSAAAASKRRDHSFEFRAARPARASPRGEPADRPRSTRALADLAWLSSRPTRGALHPTPLAEALLHRHRARSAAAASNAEPQRSNPVPRGPRALRPVENRPTAHGARARWRTWRGCLRGQRAARSTPRRWPRLFFTDTAPGRRLRLRTT